MKKHKYTYTTRYGEKEVLPATTFDINKTIMRCLVKNLAMFGLGIYIYAGDDLPMEEEVSSKTQATPTPTSGKPKLEVGDANWNAVAKFCADQKALGFKKLTDKISTKYALSAAVKNEIRNIIK